MSLRVLTISCNSDALILLVFLVNTIAFGGFFGAVRFSLLLHLYVLYEL